MKRTPLARPDAGFPLGPEQSKLLAFSFFDGNGGGDGGFVGAFVGRVFGARVVFGALEGRVFGARVVLGALVVFATSALLGCEGSCVS